MSVINGNCSATGETRFHTKANPLSDSTIKYMSTSTKHRDLERKSFLSNCFKDLEKLINNNTHDINLQSKIEEYLFNSENYFNSINKIEKPSINFSNKTSKWILEKYELIVEHLNNMIKK